MAQRDSPVLTESQVQALEKGIRKQVEGEIETEHPGYLDVKTRITWAQSKA
ncbi:hypothetical protein LEP1GSC026_4719 [Leptospira interrogans str. 2002000623]|nr:hypothetical protein LEP1GSC026_4719 [Leptospira interrogans str. 2002000623]